MTNYKAEISEKNEKVKARHLVDGLRVNFERYHSKKPKAIATLPYVVWAQEKEILKTARQENTKLFCYEKEEDIFWRNLDSPKVSRMIDQNDDVLTYQNIEMPRNGVADYNYYNNPMFIWRDYCGAATRTRMAESTEQCAKGSIVVVTFLRTSGRGSHDLDWEIQDGGGNYARSLEPYVERKFSEKDWLCIWSHPYATSPQSKMLMMAFVNCEKMYRSLIKNN